MTVTGRADVTRRGCTLELRGALISAELSGCPTSALNTGTAIIRATPVGPTFLIRDRGQSTPVVVAELSVFLVRQPSC